MNLYNTNVYRRIINHHMIRYATLVSGGIVLPMSHTRLSSLKVEVIDYGESRTLYKEKKPVCRSFNGINPYHDGSKKCGECAEELGCTPQVYLDCISSGTINSMRFMLSYTSAQNFIVFIQQNAIRNIDIKGKQIVISVKNHKSWGEAIFELVNNKE